MLALSGPTIHHRNALRFRIPANAPAESTRQAQVCVVQRFIGSRQGSPPATETAGIMPHPEISIQHDSVHAVIAPGQQILVAFAQRVRHVWQLNICRAAKANSGFWLPRLLTSAAPQGPLVRGAVPERAWDAIRPC